MIASAAIRVGAAQHLHVLMTQHFAETWDASLTFHQQSAYKPIGVPAVQQASVASIFA
jgi:hypothetical protein